MRLALVAPFLVQLGFASAAAIAQAGGTLAGRDITPSVPDPKVLDSDIEAIPALAISQFIRPYARSIFIVGNQSDVSVIVPRITRDCFLGEELEPEVERIAAGTAIEVLEDVVYYYGGNGSKLVAAAVQGFGNLKYPNAAPVEVTPEDQLAMECVNTIIRKYVSPDKLPVAFDSTSPFRPTTTFDSTTDQPYDPAPIASENHISWVPIAIIAVIVLMLLAFLITASKKGGNSSSDETLVCCCACPDGF